jgi:hypothetical protein
VAAAGRILKQAIAAFVAILATVANLACVGAGNYQTGRMAQPTLICCNRQTANQEQTAGDDEACHPGHYNLSFFGK